MKPSSQSKSLPIASFIILLAQLACNFGGQAPSLNPSQPSTPPQLPSALPPQPSALPQQLTAAPSTSSNDECSNVYFPVVEGATWSYRIISGVSTATRDDTITNVGTSSFLQEEDIINADGNGGVENSVLTWQCSPEGLLMLQPEGSLSAWVEGEGMGGSGNSQFTTLSNEGLTLPSSINPGDTWTQTIVLQVASSESGAATTTTTFKFRAVGPEEVTVPAGTFDCLRIEFTQTVTLNDLDFGTMDAVEWLSPEIGMVRMVSNYSTVELVTYNIP